MLNDPPPLPVDTALYASRRPPRARPNRRVGSVRDFIVAQSVVCHGVGSDQSQQMVPSLQAPASEGAESASRADLIINLSPTVDMAVEFSCLRLRMG